MANVPGISFKDLLKNPTIDSDYSGWELPFYKDVEYFSNFDNFVNFVKACERGVRVSNDYKRYKRYLIEDVGLNVCQVLSNITVDDSNDSNGNILEMHHGPILTLFDIISIIVDSEIANNRKITTFSIIDKCLEEHFENNVQVVMLSETVHEEVHANNIFINMKQAFGNINRFIDKYHKGLHEDQIDKINEYINISLKIDSTDNNTLKLNDTVKKWTMKGV